MQKYVLASNNPGKVREIQELLQGLPIKLIAQAEFGVPDIEETGTTFFENAIIKARHAAKLTGLPAIADDSGLAIDALNGAPGVYSARYAGEGTTDLDRINKVLAELKRVSATDFTAHFHCVMAVMQSAEDPAPLLCHGRWTGEIVQAPKGDKGFGYDPIFYVPTHRCTSAQLDPDDKNRISHRGRAIAQLIEKLQTEVCL